MENISVLSNKEQGRQLNLPPGFRFHPTDEELLTYYLYKKVTQPNFSAIAIGEVDMYKSEPWDLPWKAKMGEDEWYFFCLRDRKYQASLRSNRATRAGFWKSTGRDGEIYRGRSLIGMKKTLVFYKGRAPKGEKTNWIMHEYRLDERFSVPSSSRTNEWIICRVFRKTFGGKKTHFSGIMRWESIGNRQGYSGSVSLSPPAINIDLVHVSCFSSPCYDEDEQAGNLHSAGNSLSGIFSNPQESVPRIPLQAPMNLPLSDSAFTVQEQNFLDSVFDNRGSSLRNGFISAMMEQVDVVSPETGHTATHMDPAISSLISSFGNQQNPSASYAAPARVDLDNLNNFCSYYSY